MAKGQQKDDVLYRVVKFEIKPPTPEQENLVLQISDGLRQLYNEALGWRWRAFQILKYKKGEGIATNFVECLKEIGSEELGADYQVPDTVKRAFLIQVYGLPLMRKKDAQGGLWRAKIPANYKEETLDALDASTKSFFALRGNNDRDAQPPKARNESDFCEISGRSGFSIYKNRIILAPNIFGKETLVWPIPQEYQALMLARASKVKKFTLYRAPRDLREKGRFWISIAYEIAKPEPKPFVPEEAVYIALGASSIGVVSRHKEEVIPLWRADKHWKPRNDSIDWWLEWEGWGTNFHPLQKGSKKWRKLKSKRRTMFSFMGAQQKQDRREIVALDLLEKIVDERAVRGHGTHFVVSDIIVRSKPGAIADSSKKERGGALGLNWSAQNTGTIAYLVQWLEEKAHEYGGTVRKHKLASPLIPADAGIGHENKIPMARALRDDFLRSYDGQKSG
jgi:hypothetical protein